MDIVDAANDELARSTQRAEEAIRARQERERRAPAVKHRDCCDCDQPISEGRLAVLPLAARCIDCQGFFEHRGPM